MAKKMKRSATEDDSSFSSASSSDDDISRDETTRHRRRRPQARRNTKKKEGSYSQDKEIIKFLGEVKEEVCKQSKQVAESKEEMYKQLEKLREEMCQQSKQAIESKEEICKQLEMVKHDINQKMYKQLAEILTDLRKQWDLHTNGSSGDDSYAPRSQSNQVQPPRYRLVFKSGVTDRIEKGHILDINVALVDGSNDQAVENGPLASATVELVVVNAEFNQHNNQYNWSREDFESNIKKVQERNSATGDVDQSVKLKSIVSNGQFKLVHGARCHSGSTIFSNSSNKKVRLGVMVVSPTEERVLEALSDPFYVRGHDRPARQNNLRHNRSNTPRQALGCNGYQERNGPTPNMQNLSWPNPAQDGARTRQALVDNSYQVQNGQMPNLQSPSLPNSTQTGENRFNTTTRLPLAFLGDTTMPPSGFNINEEQLPLIGNTPMLCAEPSTCQEQRASIQYQHFPHLPMMAQAATNNQIDELSPSALVGHLRNPNYMDNSHVLVDEVGIQFSMHQSALPVQLLWDWPNVEPSKGRWNIFDKLITPPQEHFGSLSLASIQKSVSHTRQRTGVRIEPLEPDDSDEERPLKNRRQSKYRLRFMNKVCDAYYTRDQIKADDGNLLMVALFDENNTKITTGPLSSASVELVALHGDFNDNGHDDWTSEEFSRSVVCPPPGEEASSVLGGDRILILAGGEACLGDAFFQRTSFCARTGKFKMGARLLASAQEETIQEGISEQFRVIDRRVEESPGRDGGTTHKALPPGFRFQPSEMELIVEYLCPRRHAAKPFTVHVIADVDIYKFDPWELPAKAAFGEDEWYFFSPLKSNRAAGSGYWSWQATDEEERAIPLTGGDDKMLGFTKKTFVFYTGRAPKGNETSWTMDEYSLSTPSSGRLDDERALCKIYTDPRLPVQSTYEQVPRLGQQLSEFLPYNHLPPGFRFLPSDEELVSRYLRRKAADAHFIAEVNDFYSFDPWDLPGKAMFGEKEWYFFHRTDRKYPTGSRNNRATQSGYWKATGKDRGITLSAAAHNDKTLGFKKTLVFYRGRAPNGTKTSWVMHEYRLVDDSPLSAKESLASSTSSSSDVWLLCRITNKETDIPDQQLTTPVLDDDCYLQPLPRARPHQHQVK